MPRQKKRRSEVTFADTLPQEEVMPTTNLAATTAPPAPRPQPKAGHARFRLGLKVGYWVEYKDEPGKKVPYQSTRDMFLGFLARGIYTEQDYDKFSAFMKRRRQGQAWVKDDDKLREHLTSIVQVPTSRSLALAGTNLLVGGTAKAKRAARKRALTVEPSIEGLMVDTTADDLIPPPVARPGSPTPDDFEEPFETEE